MNKIILEKIVVSGLFVAGAAGIIIGGSYWLESCKKMPACLVDTVPNGQIKACAVDLNKDGEKDTILEQQLLDYNGDGKTDYIQSCEYEMNAYTLRKCGIDWNADGKVDQIVYPAGTEPKGTLL